MKSFILVLCILIMGDAVRAQWTSGSGTTYTNDNVGVGTSSPGSNLEVNKSSGDLSIGVKRGANLVASLGSGTGESGLYGFLGLFHHSQSSPSIQLFANSDNANSWVSVGSNSGNFGVGTASPGYKLDVSGNGNFTGALSGTTASFSSATLTGTTGISGTSLTMQGTGNGWNDLRISNNGGSLILGTARDDGLAPFVAGSGFASYLTTANSTSLVLGTNSAPRMTISNTGNVGIGTSSPAYKLDVDGQANFSGALYGTSGAFTGNITGLGSTLTGTSGVSSTRLTLQGTGNGWNNAAITNSGGSLWIGVMRDDGISPFTDGSSFAGYIGTTNDKDFIITTNAAKALTITPSKTAIFEGNVGIGTATPDSKLAVNGTIHSKEVKVDLVGWPDFVFRPEYKLPNLYDTEKFIKKHGHLPEIPTAREVEQHGVALGEMNARLLQKIEELTLYVIEQSKRSDKQDQIIKDQQYEISQLKSSR